MDPRRELLIFDDDPETRATLQALLSPHVSLLKAQSWSQTYNLARSNRLSAGLVGVPRSPELLKDRLMGLNTIPIPLILLIHRPSPMVPVLPDPKGPARLLLFSPFTPSALLSRVNELIDCAEKGRENTPPDAEKDKYEGEEVTVHSIQHRVDPLVTGITHRINTFLVSIKTFYQLAREQGGAGMQGELDQTIEREIEEVERLVGDLTGFVELTPAKFTETSVVSLMEEILREERNGTTIRWNPPDDLPRAWSDPMLLAYALRSLVEYLRKSGVNEIRIETGATQYPGRPSLLFIDLLWRFSSPPSELQNRVLGMYLFLAQEALRRLRAGCHHKDLKDGEERIRIELPTRPRQSDSTFEERQREERGRTVRQGGRS
jgi:hypothetical protein